MKKFSLKKLLKCILFSILVTTFIGSTLIFFDNVVMNTNVTAWQELKNDEAFVEEIKEKFTGDGNVYSLFSDQVHGLKESYGDDYPAEDILLNELLMTANTDEYIIIYIVSIIVGFVLGTVVYIVAEQKATGKVLLIEMILSVCVMGLLLLLLDVIYNFILNSIIKSAGYNMACNNYVFDTDSKEFILTTTLFVVFVVYVINITYQKIRSHRLNEELNK